MFACLSGAGSGVETGVCAWVCLFSWWFAAVLTPILKNRKMRGSARETMLQSETAFEGRTVLKMDINWCYVVLQHADICLYLPK